MRKFARVVGQCSIKPRRTSSESNDEYIPLEYEPNYGGCAEEELPKYFEYPGYPPPLPEQYADKKMSKEYRESLWRLFWKRSIPQQIGMFLSRPNIALWILWYCEEPNMNIIRDPETGKAKHMDLVFRIPVDPRGGIKGFPPVQSSNAYLEFDTWAAEKEKREKLAPNSLKLDNYPHCREWIVTVGNRPDTRNEKFTPSQWKELLTYLPNSLVEEKKVKPGSGVNLFFDEDEYLDDAFDVDVNLAALSIQGISRLKQIERMRSSKEVDELIESIKSQPDQPHVPTKKYYKQLFVITKSSYEYAYMSSLKNKFKETLKNRPGQLNWVRQMNDEVLMFIDKLITVIPRIKYLMDEQNLTYDEASDTVWKKYLYETFGDTAPGPSYTHRGTTGRLPSANLEAVPISGGRGYHHERLLHCEPFQNLSMEVRSKFYQHIAKFTPQQQAVMVDELIQQLEADYYGDEEDGLQHESDATYFGNLFEGQEDDDDVSQGYYFGNLFEGQDDEDDEDDDEEDILNQGFLLSPGHEDMNQTQDSELAELQEEAKADNAWYKTLSYEQQGQHLQNLLQSFQQTEFDSIGDELNALENEIDELDLELENELEADLDDDDLFEDQGANAGVLALSPQMNASTDVVEHINDAQSQPVMDGQGNVVGTTHRHKRTYSMGGDNGATILVEEETEVTKLRPGKASKGRARLNTCG